MDGLTIHVPPNSAGTTGSRPSGTFSPLPPPLPPRRDGLPQSLPAQDNEQYAIPPYNKEHRPLPHSTDFGGVPAPLPIEPKDDPRGANTSTTFNPTQSAMVSARQLTKLSAVDRSRVLRVARMEPHLQFMCGPLLKFDTIDDDGVWHGAAMIVTADSGSIYEPYPTLQCEWDPERVLPNTFSRFQSPGSNTHFKSTNYQSASPVDTRKRSFSFARKSRTKDVAVGLPGTARSASSTAPRINTTVRGRNSTTQGEYTPTGPHGPSAWNSLHGVPSFDLGPHPADPHTTLMPASPMLSSFGNLSQDSSSTSASLPHIGNGASPISTEHSDSSRYPPQGKQESFPQPQAASFPYGGPNGYGILNQTPSSSVRTMTIEGQDFYCYGGIGGTFTFWRFKIKVPLGEREMGVRYSINGGQKMEFYVPAKTSGMRLAVHSCNGFSAGVNPDDFRGPGFKSGYDPLWMDLLAAHAEQPFHCLVGGGDQLYCDSLMREPEMQEWVTKSKPEDKRLHPLTEEMSLCLERFFFNHYCQHFRSGAFARANSSIPMLNMCDDHDLIDGFGSYPDELQMAPVFRAVGARGYFFFLLFQCFINPEVDGISDAPGRHFYQSMIIGPELGPYIPLPSHSSLSRLGPKEYILMLDCRAERKKDQVCSPGEYAKVFQRLHALPEGVEHLIVQLGIPIAYPRMVFLESALESKFNPLVALARGGNLGLGGFVNKFNADAELLDDLSDHWTASLHKKERNWFIEQLQHFARSKRIRVSFVSGDVHCAAVGVLKTLKQKNKPELRPEEDWRYMQNITTSAIVNTPPPGGVIAMVASLATKVHRTMHYAETDEIMLPLFSTDPSGVPRKQRFIMGRRNYCTVQRNEAGSLVFDIRVEREKGYGATVGYTTLTPPPGWVAAP